MFSCGSIVSSLVGGAAVGAERRTADAERSSRHLASEYSIPTGILIGIIVQKL